MKIAKLSEQAMTAIMICFQKAIAEETSILPLLLELDFIVKEDILVVTNPPRKIQTAKKESGDENN